MPARFSKISTYINTTASAITVDLHVSRSTVHAEVMYIIACMHAVRYISGMHTDYRRS